MASLRQLNLLHLHFIVFIWGFTAILGALLNQVPSFILVWYRMLIASIGVLAYMYFTGQKINFNHPGRFKLLLVGLTIALHWILFFEAIKQSNVSVTLAVISSNTLFVAIIEPLIFKRKVRMFEIELGLVVMFTLGYILLNEKDAQNVAATQLFGKNTFGVFLALGASLCASYFGTLNGILVNQHSVGQITFFEMLGGFLGISIYLLATQNYGFAALAISAKDLIYLLVLGLVCTAYAFFASVHVLRVLSPFTVAITINLEPVYGIIMAVYLFGNSEKMTPVFYIGALVILIAIFINAWLNYRYTKYLSV